MIRANKIEYWSGVGDAQQVIQAIAVGNDVNATSEGGYTALHAAAENNHTEIVRILLKHGANPNAQLENGVTPAEIAEHNGYLEVASILRSAM
jgi:uncharacterized protein